MIIFLLYSSMALLSWNLNGYRFHFADLQPLLVEHQPLSSCLQETHLLPEHCIHLCGYVCYRKDTDDDLYAHGGFAILAHDFVHSPEIKLQSTLPVVAVKVTMPHLSFIALCDLFSKLPTPFVVIGDFNAHTPSGALIGPVREGHFSRNYILLIISLF